MNSLEVEKAFKMLFSCGTFLLRQWPTVKGTGIYVVNDSGCRTGRYVADSSVGNIIVKSGVLKG